MSSVKKGDVLFDRKSYLEHIKAIEAQAKQEAYQESEAFMEMRFDFRPDKDETWQKLKSSSFFLC